MIKWKGIVLHCSDSSFGTKELIDEWHINGNGWSECGYSFVICNGFITKTNFDPDFDGKIQKGRSLNKLGAHCIGKNDHIGICLIGLNQFTIKQLDSLIALLLQLTDDYSIPISKIHAHNEFSNKTCPNFDVELIKKMMRKGMCLEHPDFK